MRERFYRFMQGRYGLDQLGKFTLILSVILIFSAAFFMRYPVVYSTVDMIGLAGVFYSYFRMFSRNIAKRAAENRDFLQLTGRLRNRKNRFLSRQEMKKTYRIFACPECGQKIRIPKGKGKVEIDCPKCHEKFIRKA